MDSASPNKRRALAALNANAMSPHPRPRDSKLLSPSKAPFGTASMEDAAARASSRALTDSQAQPVAAKKRSLEAENSLDGKRSRVVVDDAADQSRSASPDESSFFDTTVSSAGEGDASWTTNITEPDMAPPVSFRRRVPLTREQAREKAEMLKARLGLASYKVRTGQTGMSLAQLEAKQRTAGANDAGARSTSTATAGDGTLGMEDAKARNSAPDVEGRHSEHAAKEQDERQGSNEDVAMADKADGSVQADQRLHVDAGGHDQVESGLLSLARSASELSQIAS